MAQNNVYRSIIWVISVLFLTNCERELPVQSYYEEKDESIVEYIQKHDDDFSYFLRVLEEANLNKTLSAQNPHGAKYTLFLPTNEAFEKFFQNSNKYNSMDELLADKQYVNALGRYHVVNLGINSNDFPFGALPDTTLTGDLLSLGFKIVSDTTQYIVNNNAPIIQQNIEMTNGYIHVVGGVLSPVIINSYEWLKEQGNFYILVQAMEVTGLSDTFGTFINNGKGQLLRNTILAETDQVFNKAGIYSVEDLKQRVSDSTNYSDYSNGLYQFVAYHILDDYFFLNDFEGQNSNYNTYGSLPVKINGTGIDIKVNEGVSNFDTIIGGSDTTVINFINIDYDNSNIITRNGSIHLISDAMFLYEPPRSNRKFEFYEDPIIKKASTVYREHIFEEPEDFTNIWWSGTESINYINSSVEINGCSNNDYLLINGDFIITYKIPKILPGKYKLLMNCDSRGNNNATIQVFLDGKKVGRDVDLTSGAKQGDFFEEGKELLIGHVVFSNYEMHEIKIQPLINGIFIWDYIVFEKE